jgi:predicted phosphodiesterase
MGLRKGPRVTPGTDPTPPPNPVLGADAVINAAAVAADHAHAQRLGRAKAEGKALADRVLELETTVEFMHRVAAHPPSLAYSKSRPKSGKRTADPVFFLSDLHFGETVTRVESLNQNEYDMAEAKRRFGKCIDNMLWLRRSMVRDDNTCDNSLVVLGGDIVSGDIHDELKETNDGGLFDQCVEAVATIAPGIKAIADATPGVTHVVCVGGNHGRLTKKKQIKNNFQHSVEHIGVYHPLRIALGDLGGKIAWHIPRAERFIFDAFGRRISIQHGDMCRSQGGIGGVLVPLTRWATRDAKADLYLVGHFHQAELFGRVMINGSLIGESAYTGWLGVESRPPEQVAFVFDADRGVRRFERVSVT